MLEHDLCLIKFMREHVEIDRVSDTDYFAPGTS